MINFRIFKQIVIQGGSKMRSKLQEKFLFIFGSLIIITVLGLQVWNYTQSVKQVNQNEKEQTELITSFVEEKMEEQIRVANHSLMPIVNSPIAKELFAKGERDNLYDYMKNTFHDLEQNGISQLQFHTTNAHSFLRVHQPEKFDDDLSSFRKTVVDANENKQTIEGLEEGVAGYGFRVVSPMEFAGEHIGSVEVGTDFGEDFLTGLKEEIGGEFFIYSFTHEEDTFLAATLENDTFDVQENIIDSMEQSNEIKTIHSDDKRNTILLIPYTDYQGDVKGYIKSIIPRDSTIAYMNSMTINAVITGIISLVIMLAVTFYLINSITRPIRNVAHSMERVAAGDLSIDKITVRSKDEIRDLAVALNTMVDSLRATLFAVGEASDQVAASSEQLLASAEETTRASEQVSESAADSAEQTEGQLKGVHEVTVTVEEMARGMDSISQDSSELLHKTETVTNVVQTGNESVQDVNVQMSSIQESVDTLSEIIKSLNLRTNEIGNIIQFITDISEQTNLLALNAAIEAARAGDSGAGFAVVADEVRNLAEQSAQSTTQIANLIKTIQGEITNAVEAMKENASKVNEGMEKTDNVRQAFRLIESSISEVNEFTEEVAASVEQMSAGSEQIVEAIANIKEAAEINTALGHETSAASEQQMAAMEEISSSSEALAHLAMELQNEIRKFKI